MSGSAGHGAIWRSCAWFCRSPCPRHGPGPSRRRGPAGTLGCPVPSPSEECRSPRCRVEEAELLLHRTVAGGREDRSLKKRFLRTPVEVSTDRGQTASARAPCQAQARPARGTCTEQCSAELCRAVQQQIPLRLQRSLRKSESRS